MDDTDLKEEHL